MGSELRDCLSDVSVAVEGAVREALTAKTVTGVSAQRAHWAQAARHFARAQSLLADAEIVCHQRAREPLP
jgi:hypothetical protein